MRLLAKSALLLLLTQAGKPAPPLVPGVFCDLSGTPSKGESIVLAQFHVARSSVSSTTLAPLATVAMQIDERGTVVHCAVAADAERVVNEQVVASGQPSDSHVPYFCVCHGWEPSLAGHDMFGDPLVRWTDRPATRAPTR
jgi:hypothetical protein